jgi:LacI family transcriptional regulator, gluconate utilization system Gnt-I transcriptional repressor
MTSADTRKLKKPRSSSTGRVTLADIAERVGVATITVSRAFRTPSIVADGVREKIEQAARELGYLPNRAASTLASARSMNVAVLVPSISNVVFVDTLRGVDEVLRVKGYQLLIGITGYDSREEERQLRKFVPYGPDGIILTGFEHSEESWRLLGRTGVPTVHMMELTEDRNRYCVGFSQEAAGFDLTRHLIERGRRKIAFVGVQLDPRTLRRYEGYRRALTEAGLYDRNHELLLSEASSIRLGGPLLELMLAKAPDTDAIFFCNDDIAHGALFQCLRRGISVPDQLAVVGFNDLDASAHTVPALTTIATPRREVGREAAKMLVLLMAGEHPDTHSLDLGYSLKVRESS